MRRIATALLLGLLWAWALSIWIGVGVGPASLGAGTVSLAFSSLKGDPATVAAFEEILRRHDRPGAGLCPWHGDVWEDFGLKWPRFLRMTQRCTSRPGSTAFATETTTYLQVPLWLIALIVAPPTGIAWYRHLHQKSGHCLRCGYDLTGNVSGRCPECGESANAASYPVRSRAREYALLKCALVIYGALAVASLPALLPLSLALAPAVPETSLAYAWRCLWAHMLLAPNLALVAIGASWLYLGCQRWARRFVGQTDRS